VALVVGTRGHNCDPSYLFVFRVNPRQIEIANQYSTALWHKIYWQNPALPNGDYQLRGGLNASLRQLALLVIAGLKLHLAQDEHPPKKPAVIATAGSCVCGKISQAY
jgi:hypothetical protein